MSFPRNSAFSPPAPAEPRKTPEPAPVSIVTSREIVSHADLERWYHMVDDMFTEFDEPNSIGELRDELYSRLS